MLVVKVHAAEDQTPQNHDENYRNILQYSHRANETVIVACCR